MRQRGSILVGLLWCLALLSIAVIGVLHTTRMDMMVQKNYGDRIQAHYLALAGVEKAKALLYQNLRDRSRNGRSHDGAMFNAPDQFQDAHLGRGVFNVLRRGRDAEGNGLLFGVSDEEGLLNVNSASIEQLAKLTYMTPDVAAAIIDWRDRDSQVTPGGAEIEYYSALIPPSQPRNAAFETLRELLMVRGVTPQLLFGSDRHGNGMIGSGDEENPELSSDVTDTGWAGALTVDSLNNNVSASGDTRVDIQTADENALTAVHGITADAAHAIVAYRGQHQFQSVADLLDVTPPQQNQGGGGRGGGPGGAPGGGGGAGGVISQELLMDIADQLTTETADNLPGVVNVNSASLNVLICLPGVDRQLAQSIINYRQSSGYLPNIAHLLKVSGMTQDIFKQLGPLVTARSETFRILCEGKVASSGARQRIQAIVHVGLKDITTVSWREDDL